VSIGEHDSVDFFLDDPSRSPDADDDVLRPRRVTESGYTAADMLDWPTEGKPLYIPANRVSALPVSFMTRQCVWWF
jgi:hypothetical protein